MTFPPPGISSSLPQASSEDRSSVQLLPSLPAPLASALAAAKSETPPRPFPRWGATIEEEDTIGLDSGPLFNFIVNSSAYYHAPSKDFRDPRYRATSDHGTAVGKWYPEVLYVLDRDGLWVSQRHRTAIAERGGETLGYKVQPVERQMMAAWHLFRQEDPTVARQKWPHLSRVLGKEGEAASSSSGFPFLIWHGDYTGCNERNWQQQYSIPIFTVAASVDCNFTFPFPNHKVSTVDPHFWDTRIQEYAAQYPWDQKKPQIVWRGSLTGKMPQGNVTARHARWQMLQRLHDLKQQHDSSSSSSPFLFDVGATRLPKLHKNYAPYLGEVGGIGEPIQMEDFQKYRGIIDLDGNSWSSRFGELLCYNSVILKVQPQWVDYFYYPIDDVQDRLQPWVHYIPIQADLSDLLEWSAFVVDSRNDAWIRPIVARANDWCRHHWHGRQVALDMLHIWERYVELLDIHDTDWSRQGWPSAKAFILDESTSSPLGMVPAKDVS